MDEIIVPKGHEQIVSQMTTYVNFYFRSSKPKTCQKQLMINTLEIKIEKHRYCPEMRTVRNTCASMTLYV